MFENPQPTSHAPLFDRPLSASMGRAVRDHLAALTPLPTSGCVAGQSVMSALLALYASDAHRGHTGPIKDVDVFCGAQDRLLESGFLDGLKTAGSADTGLWSDPLVSPNDYDRLFDCRLNIERVQVIGLLNLIEMSPSGQFNASAALMNDDERLDTVLSEFDLSVVQVGVDLKTGQLRWTPGFAAVARGEPVQAAEIGLAERSWMRYQRKRVLMPWLAWDDAQIRSTVQLAQIRVFALMAGDANAPVTLAAWKASPAVAHLHELPESARLTPIWDWKACADRSASFAEVERMHSAGEFALSARDSVLLKSFVAIFRPNTDPNTLNIERPTGQALAAAKDGLVNLIRRGDDAALGRYLDAGGSLLDGASPADFRLGRRPGLIHEAINWNRLSTAGMLLDAGFTPNDRGVPLGNTAYLQLLSRMHNVSAAVGEDAPIELLARMRQMGADVTLPYGLDSTILHEAVFQVDIDWLTREFPHHAAHRNLTNAWGRWPHEGLEGFMQWIPEKSQAIASLFGATPKEFDAMELTASLMRACRSGELDEVRRALARGAPAGRGTVVSPLFEAAHHGHAPVVQALLGAGADAGVMEENGRTPLMVAARQGHAGVVMALLQAGARVDEVDKEGNSALSYAALSGKADIVSVLARQGAQTNPVLSNGCRLLETAAGRQCAGMPAVLAVLAGHLSEETGFAACEAICKLAKASAAKWSHEDNIAALDSALAMLHVEQMIGGHHRAPRLAA